MHQQPPSNPGPFPPNAMPSTEEGLFNGTHTLSGRKTPYQNFCCRRLLGGLKFARTPPPKRRPFRSLLSAACHGSVKQEDAQGEAPTVTERRFNHVLLYYCCKCLQGYSCLIHPSTSSPTEKVLPPQRSRLQHFLVTPRTTALTTEISTPMKISTV